MTKEIPVAQFNVRLPVTILRAIEAEAKRRQVSKTYIAERALTAWLDRHHDPLAAPDNNG
jgi:hypothetical protein